MVSTAHPPCLLFPHLALVMWVLLRLSLIDPNCMTDQGLNSAADQSHVESCLMF